jgi:serine/threonine protein kinase
MTEVRLSPGYRLGPYEVLSVLGAGGMGEVYRARDIRLDRTVAVKELPAAMAADTERRERFEREARAVSALNHPNICALYDVGRQDDLEYLVMELVDGETLADRLTRGPLPLDQALKLGSEIASALTRAHRQGIVHRDLKPGNVMLTRQGAKLLDFGLARMEVPGSATAGTVLVTHLPTQPRPITQAGAVLGTFQYMSPEQLEGREADARTDIFSFGALLYEAITGRRAFEGASQASLISAIMTGSPTSISSLQPTTPPALDRVIRTCLAKDPDERWQTAQDLGAELKWIAEGGSQTSGPVPSVPPRRSRERWAWAVAGLLGLVAATAVAQLITVETPRREVTRFAVPPRGGVPTVVVPVKAGEASLSPAWPVFLPDGRHFLFVYSDDTGPRSLQVGSIDTGEITDLGPIRSRVEYGAGHIYYLEQQTLMARPFLSDSRRFTGEPFPVASDRLTDDDQRRQRFVGVERGRPRLRGRRAGTA